MRKNDSKRNKSIQTINGAAWEGEVEFVNDVVYPCEHGWMCPRVTPSPGWASNAAQSKGAGSLGKTCDMVDFKRSNAGASAYTERNFSKMPATEPNAASHSDTN